MTEKQKVYFTKIIPIVRKICEDIEITHEEIKEAFSAYLPYCDSDKLELCESIINANNLNESVAIIKNSNFYNSYIPSKELEESMLAGAKLQKTIEENYGAIFKNSILDKGILKNRELKQKIGIPFVHNDLALNSLSSINVIKSQLGETNKVSGIFNIPEINVPELKLTKIDEGSEPIAKRMKDLSERAAKFQYEKEQRSLRAMVEVKDAVLEHKESTDKAIYFHDQQLGELKMHTEQNKESNELYKQQIYELKGHTSQNKQAIELHTNTLKELETANGTLKTQVSQLASVVQLLINQLEETKNQTGELADTNAKIHIQIEQAEEELRKQKEINKSQRWKNRILFAITIISFCITVLTFISNPNIHKLLRRFFG